MTKKEKGKRLSKANNKVDIKQFLNIHKPEVAYFLGFLWADGYLNKNTNEVSIGIISKDMDILFPTFKKIGIWNKYEYKRKKWQQQTEIKFSNFYIHEFLKNNDYLDKSTKSPEKILSKIPEELKHYFFRGLSDGDGCFYYHNSGIYQFSISGTYNQDWGAFNDLLKYLHVENFKLKQTILKNSKSSAIRITNKKGVILFGNYIYKNYEYDKIGLDRKYEKFKIIKERASVLRFYTTESKQRLINSVKKSINIDELKNMWLSGFSKLKISKMLNVSDKLIDRRLKEFNLI